MGDYIYQKFGIFCHEKCIGKLKSFNVNQYNDSHFVILFRIHFLDFIIIIPFFQKFLSKFANQGMILDNLDKTNNPQKYQVRKSRPS